MIKISAELFSQFILAVETEEELLSKHLNAMQRETQEGGMSQTELKPFDKDARQKIWKECIAEYVGNLKGHDNFQAEYYHDIKDAASQDNLYLLDILIGVPSLIPLLNFVIDNFLLNYFVVFFKRSDDKRKNDYAKYLFEQVLDTAENDREEYIEIINGIFSLGKDSAWYEDFESQITKLIYKAPVRQKALLVIKKGLVGTSEGIKSEIQEYINAKYHL